MRKHTIIYRYGQTISRAHVYADDDTMALKILQNQLEEETERKEAGKRNPRLFKEMPVFEGRVRKVYPAPEPRIFNQ